MRLSAVLFACAALFFAAVAGRDFSYMPSCALMCIYRFAAYGGCRYWDAPCMCALEYRQKMKRLVSPCFKDACSPVEIKETWTIWQEACDEIPKSVFLTDTAPETGTMQLKSVVVSAALAAALLLL